MGCMGYMGCMAVGYMGCRPWLAVPQVESKVTLALGGIAVVLGAVVAAMGFLALLGLPSSLIILEVVPFLVLAVGADNIFIFVQEYQVWHPWVLRGRGVGIVCAIGCWGPLGWRALGCTHGCWGPYGVEGIGVHPWMPGSLGLGGRWVPLGTRVHLWVGGHWGAPMAAGVPMGWVGIGFPWVLGSLWGGWALAPFGLEGIGVHLWVPRPPWGGWTLGTFGCWGVPLGWRALGCTHGCHDPLGVSGRWDPHSVLSHRAGIALGRVDLGVLGVLGSPGGASPFGAPLGAGGSL